MNCCLRDKIVVHQAKQEKKSKKRSENKRQLKERLHLVALSDNVTDVCLAFLPDKACLAGICSIEVQTLNPGHLLARNSGNDLDAVCCYCTAFAQTAPAGQLLIGTDGNSSRCCPIALCSVAVTAVLSI